jgi:hypothetical protein
MAEGKGRGIGRGQRRFGGAAVTGVNYRFDGTKLAAAGMK